MQLPNCGYFNVMRLPILRQIEKSDWMFLKKWLGIAFILHVIAALLSSGFYHTDEHFQILEFVAYKLGRTSPSDLAIEFGYSMRPWLLPSIYYGLIRAFQGLRILSPFAWATCFRVLSAIIGWATLVGMALLSFRWVPNRVFREWVIRLSALLWFLPALHARLSSENLGGSIFLAGFLLLFLSVENDRDPPSWKTCLGAGLLWGAAFEFRYQVGFMILGASLWLLIFARVGFKQILAALTGIMILVGLGTAADTWGYGHSSFAPWNYIQFNLIQGHVSDVDTSPWWDYFRRAFTETWPPLGLIVFCAFPIAWIRKPKHPLTWALVPFFLIHELIGHKELRFLFPIALASPMLFIFAIESSFVLKSRFIRTIGFLLLFMNGVALLTLTFTPAWMPIRFYEHVYAEANAGRLTTMAHVGDNPYLILGIPLGFYKAENLKLERFESLEDFAKKLDHHSARFLFQTHASLPAQANLLESRCRPAYSVLPTWVHRFNYYGVMDRVTNWTVFECN